MNPTNIRGNLDASEGLTVPAPLRFPVIYQWTEGRRVPWINFWSFFLLSFPNKYGSHKNDNSEIELSQMEPKSCVTIKRMWYLVISLGSDGYIRTPFMHTLFWLRHIWVYMYEYMAVLRYELLTDRYLCGLISSFL